MLFTKHAKQRFTERFPDCEASIERVYAESTRTGKKTRKRVRKTCPAHEYQWTGSFGGAYIRAHWKYGCLFIVKPPETIITVLEV